jgi:hypothetical protein
MFHMYVCTYEDDMTVTVKAIICDSVYRPNL